MPTSQESSNEIFVVHGVFENQSSDPSDALDMHEGYQLSDSAAAARRRPRMSPGVFGLHRIAAVNSSVCGLATMLWRVTDSFRFSR